MIDNFYDRLETVCESVGISPYKLALKIELHPQAIYKYKDGSVPTMDTLAKMKDLYPSINLDYLIMGSMPVLLSDGPETSQRKKEIHVGQSNTQEPNKVIEKLLESFTETNTALLQFLRENTPKKP